MGKLPEESPHFLRRTAHKTRELGAQAFAKTTLWTKEIPLYEAILAVVVSFLATSLFWYVAMAKADSQTSSQSNSSSWVINAKVSSVKCQEGRADVAFSWSKPPLSVERWLVALWDGDSWRFSESLSPQTSSYRWFSLKGEQILFWNVYAISQDSFWPAFSTYGLSQIASCPDNVSLKVQIRTPYYDSLVIGKVTVSAKVAGGQSGIKRVSFFLNNRFLGEDKIPTASDLYMVSIDTSRLSGGWYVIAAVAEDRVGNRSNPAVVKMFSLSGLASSAVSSIR